MVLEKVVVGPLYTNCYCLSQDDKTIIVDPGGNPEKILEIIPTRTLEAIILTHAHPDHLGAISFLKNEYPECKIYLHKDDLPIYKQAGLASRFYLRTGLDKLPEPDFFLSEGKFTINHLSLTIYHTPGHSPGSICAQIKDLLFTGDTLFKNGIGRTDFPFSDKNKMKESLTKLAKLPGNLIIYPGHGEKSTLLQALERLPKHLLE
jgi:hydroxyacylglutathione hydrolase